MADAHPSQGAVWNDLGILYYQRGLLEESYGAFARVVRLDRRNVGAIAAAANILLRLERFADALGAAEVGLKQQSQHGPLLEVYACALRGVGRFDEAFDAFDRAIAYGHNRAAMLALKANGQLEIGAFADARATLEKALEAAPDLAAAWHALADIRPFTVNDPMLGTMEHVLAESGNVQAPEPRTLMHFALARAYHKSGDTPNAFHHYEAGNALKRSTLDYDVSSDEDFARERIAAVPAERVRLPSLAGASTRAPIFVLGMPRSGTTLVEQILASHPDVFGAGEIALFDRAIDECGTTDTAALGKRYIALLDAVAPSNKRVVDKLPSNFRHAGLIHLALPNAKIVHCTRDVLDTCWSCYATLFTGRQDFAYDLADIGRYYRAYYALMSHWHRALPPGIMLDVRYEKLIADIGTTARGLLAFCDLPWNDAVLRFYETPRAVRTASYNRVRQPIDATSIGTGQRYYAYLQPLIDIMSQPQRRASAAPSE